MSLHVNYEIRWKNYRAFEDTDWITIKPLTILLGPNNSGKSSIIGPLLLMNQTLLSGEAVAPLVTRGPLIDTGSFRDLVHKHDMDRKIFFGFRFHRHEQKARGRTKPAGAYPPGALEVTLSAGSQQQNSLLSRFEIFDIHLRSLFSQARTRSGKYSFKSTALKNLRKKEITAIGDNKPMNFLFPPVGALIGVRTKGEELKARDLSESFQKYISALGIVLEELQGIFRRSSYIGPLRERPRRAYEIEGETPRSVGPRGEHMANLVRTGSNELRRELDRWVRRFEFGSKLVVRQISEEFFSLSFEGTNPRSRINIADAGFGASQVLPLIVQALTARKESLTIAEQPEIHLNPRLQYELADLFAEMANNDKRVIVETHSEHLLLRLRRLIALGKIDCSKVALYFVEMKHGISTVRAIPFGRNGQIPPETWPSGFFEDTLRESIALATAQSKRRQKLTVHEAKEDEEKCS
jgi:predicted ATPase